MSTNRASRRVLTVFTLLVTLVLASLPAQAGTARHPAAARQVVAAFGENSLSRVWSLFVNLWPQGMTKEGVTIDPDGAAHHAGVTISPDAGRNDEGTSIDPNGRQ